MAGACRCGAGTKVGSLKDTEESFEFLGFSASRERRLRMRKEEIERRYVVREGGATRELADKRRMGD